MAREKQGRASCDIDEETLMELVKSKITNPGADLGWMSMNTLAFIEEHQQFLHSLVPHTRRVNKQVLKRCVKSVWELTWDIADEFAAKVQKAYSHCLHSKQSFSTGAKMEHGRKKVVAFMIARHGPDDELPPSPSCSPERYEDTVAVAPSANEVAASQSFWETPATRDQQPTSLATATDEAASADSFWGVSCVDSQPALGVGVPAKKQVAGSLHTIPPR